MPSCLPRSRRLAAPEVPSKEALHAGARVKLAGLHATEELNGRLCEVVRFDVRRDRYVVRLLPVGVNIFLHGRAAATDDAHDEGRAIDNMKLVKVDNLRLAPAIPSDRAPKTVTQFM